MYDDAAYIISIGCEMFECQNENENLIVNGQDGTSFLLSEEEYIESNYCDGYAVKQTSTWHEDENIITHEIIDKKGKAKHKIKFPTHDSYNYYNVIVLNEELYSYQYEGETYIKTW